MIYESKKEREKIEMDEMEIEFRKKIKRFEDEFNVNVVEIKEKLMGNQE